MKIYKLKGMDCANCAVMLESDLEDNGIKCKCSYSKSYIEVDETANFDKIKNVVESFGCSIYKL